MHKGMDYDKKSSGSMSNTKASSGKQVKAGKGTIRTPFVRAIIRDIGRRK
jgi:hypothetical protein